MKITANSCKKLLSTALAALLLTQIMPVTALDDVAANTYDPEEESYEETLLEDVSPVAPIDETQPEEPEATEPETEEPEITEPEVTEPETEEPETEPAISILAIQWKNGGSDIPYASMRDNDSVIANYLDLRVRLSAEAETAEITLDGATLETRVEGSLLYASVEVYNGRHTIVVTVNGDVTVEKVFDVNGITSYPSFSAEASETVAPGGLAEITLSAKKVKEMDTLTLEFAYNADYKIAEVVVPDGFAGEYSWYRGVLTVNLTMEYPGLFHGEDFLTIRFKAPAELTAEDALNVTLISGIATPVSNNSYTQSESFMGTIVLDEITIVPEI